MQEVDKLNRLYQSIGAKAAAHASLCDDGGRLSELVLVRSSDGKVIRWRQTDGNAALTRAFLFGEAPR